MVILRVLEHATGINVGDWYMADAFAEADKILNNPGDWQNGIDWESPYEWGNPTFTEDEIKKLLPEFWDVLRQGKTGPKDNEILYIGPGKDFFIVTRGQNYTLCKNKSCVKPAGF